MAIQRSLEQAPNRARLKYWQGLDPTGFEKGPEVLSGESLHSINAAGTGEVNLISSNANDAVVVGANVAIQTEVIRFDIAAGAAAADYDCTRIIPYPWMLVSVNERHQTLGTDAGAVTLMVKKVPSGTAKASGTDMLAAGLNLKSTIDTNQAGALNATAANYTGAAGDGIALVSTGTLTAVDGVSVAVEIKRL